MSFTSFAPPTIVFNLNDLQDGDPLYLGKAGRGNAWLVQKFSTSAGTMLYATIVNNPNVTTYASAWNNRATLVYNQYQVVGF